jgi:hypothetical protein
MTARRFLSRWRRSGETLAGVVALTPLNFFVYLSGAIEAFNVEAHEMREWRLRSSGYTEQAVTPACWSPRRRLCVRHEVWPDDAPWIDGNEEANRAIKAFHPYSVECNVSPEL